MAVLAPLFLTLAAHMELSAQGIPSYAGPGAGGAAGTSAVGDPAISEAEALIESAFQSGHAGDYDGGLAQLRQAERTLGDVLGRDATSRVAAEALGVVYFYQGYYGDSEGFDKAIEFLTHVLEVDPAAIGAGRYLAHTYHHLGDGGAARSYARWVSRVAPDPALVGEMAEIERALDEVFLSGWYAYADFYESDDSRVIEFDARTKRTTTALQITPQIETQLGAQGLQKLTADLTPSPDTQTRDYLQTLVDKLSARSPQGPPFNNIVDLVESDEVNAMALPGRIVVHTGLLRFAENEAELVTVLSHELAHVYAHHAARQLVGDTRNRGLTNSLIDLTGVRDHIGGGELGQRLFDMGVDVGLDLILKGYQRDHEVEADRYGTHIAFNAGYNPTYMTSFFIRLYEANPNSPFKLLATHPPYTERIDKTSGHLEQFPLGQELQIDSREFQEMKRRIR